MEMYERGVIIRFQKGCYRFLRLCQNETLI